MCVFVWVYEHSHSILADLLAILVGLCENALLSVVYLCVCPCVHYSFYHHFVMLTLNFVSFFFSVISVLLLCVKYFVVWFFILCVFIIYNIFLLLLNLIFVVSISFISHFTRYSSFSRAVDQYNLVDKIYRNLSF